MEVCCCRCGRGFFTFELEQQILDWHVCPTCEFQADVLGGCWNDVGFDDQVVRERYFRGVSDMLHVDPSKDF